MPTDKQIKMRDRMQSLLEQAKIPYKNITVIVGGYIHIDCVGFETCNKWFDLLSQFCSKVTHNEKFFHNKVNKNTVLMPSGYKGYSIHGRV